MLLPAEKNLISNTDIVLLNNYANLGQTMFCNGSFDCSK